MGPPESATSLRENQEGRRRRLLRRPRMRCCLLKGCEKRFHPRQARQRYCSEACREAAREWSRWKAPERYRATRAGKQQRNGQSLRYRERAKTRKPVEPEAVHEAARVITTNCFFARCCDRPGCYERFPPQRRSPLQHFCSPGCRGALERVREREQRWKQARDLIRRY
jgi:hypothetical protein